MYLLRIKLFVFLLILSTATAPYFRHMFGKSSSSKHAVRQNDANKEKGASDYETGGTSQSTENKVKKEQVAICKSELNSEGYYDYIEGNWSKARNRMLVMRDLDQYGGEEYDKVFGLSTECGRIYTETLSNVDDPSSPAYTELQGATDFCRTNSSCVSSHPLVINYHEENNDHNDYYD